MQGKTLAELAVGDLATFSKTITESDVYLFAGITGDFNPMHVNEDYAKSTIFGRRIAHGALTTAMAAGVLGMQLPGPGTVAIESSERYLKPVYFGDTITVEARVAELLPDRNRVRMALSWHNQRDELVAEGLAWLSPPKAGPR